MNSTVHPDFLLDLPNGVVVATDDQDWVLVHTSATRGRCWRRPDGSVQYESTMSDRDREILLRTGLNRDNQITRTWLTLQDPKLFWSQVPTDKIEAFFDAMPGIASPWRTYLDGSLVTRGTVLCQNSTRTFAAAAERWTEGWIATRRNSLPEDVCFDTKEEAMAFLDKKLIERGWRLL